MDTYSWNTDRIHTTSHTVHVHISVLQNGLRMRGACARLVSYRDAKGPATPRPDRRPAETIVPKMRRNASRSASLTSRCQPFVCAASQPPGALRGGMSHKAPEAPAPRPAPPPSAFSRAVPCWRGREGRFGTRNARFLHRTPGQGSSYNNPCRPP